MVLFLACCQSKMIYIPRAYDEATVKQANARPVVYETKQGSQTAWIHPKDAQGEGLVWLVFGGNGTVALDWDGFFDSPVLRQDTFVLVDYPSYGRSEGHPSPKAIVETVEKVVPAVAASLGTTEASLRPRLRVFGHSLGASAGLLAMEKNGITRGVILAPFTSMKDMARRVVGWPLCEVLHHRFDNTATLTRLQKQGGFRIVALHGTEDEVIPVDMGRELGRRFPGLVEYRDLPEARHNDVLNTDTEAVHAAMESIRQPL
jgi:pimeloyl-ACP methyl ester carboxylesterase